MKKNRILLSIILFSLGLIIFIMAIINRPIGNSIESKNNIELAKLYSNGVFIPYNYSYTTTVDQIINDYKISETEDYIHDLISTGNGALSLSKQAMIHNYKSDVEYEFSGGKICSVLYKVQLPQENFDEAARGIYEELNQLFSDYFESSHGDLNEMSVTNPFSCTWISSQSKLLYSISFDSIDATKSLDIYISNMI